MSARRIACIRIPPGEGAPPGDALVALAGALLAAAPRVTPARGHPRALWADASGMERRGGDAATVRVLLAAAASAGFPGVRVGVAATCIAAAAATRERGTQARVVPPGADARYLRRRSLSLLPVPPDLQETLRLLGLKTCGELAALSPADVELRFGAEGVAAWRLASADDPRWPFRPEAAGAAAAETGFEPAIETTEPLRFVLPGLVDAVVRQLEARQRIPARLSLVLRTEPAGEEERREVRPARPTADRRVLADLCRRAVEAAPLAGPVREVRLEAPEEGVARADQLDAFRAPAPDPGALHAALLPVFARWGDEALAGAVRQGAHLPAEHARWDPLGSDGVGRVAGAHRPDAAAGSASPDPPSVADLPLCLRRLPEPCAVRVREDAERRPLGVDAGSVPAPLLSRVGEGYPRGMWKTRSEGPERISASWWAGGTAREYWRVESPEGWLGLVYRDGATGGWYLEGWYD